MHRRRGRNENGTLIEQKKTGVNECFRSFVRVGSFGDCEMNRFELGFLLAGVKISIRVNFIRNMTKNGGLYFVGRFGVHISPAGSCWGSGSGLTLTPENHSFATTFCFSRKDPDILQKFLITIKMVENDFPPKILINPFVLPHRETTLEAEFGGNKGLFDLHCV